jgi:hypothetical protein
VLAVPRVDGAAGGGAGGRYRDAEGRGRADEMKTAEDAEDAE